MTKYAQNFYLFVVSNLQVDSNVHLVLLIEIANDPEHFLEVDLTRGNITPLHGEGCIVYV